MIYGKVLPGSWKRYQEDRTHRGYWGEPPSEYRELIFPLCEQEQVEFVPIDWVELDVWLDFDPFRGDDDNEREALKAELERWLYPFIISRRLGVGTHKFIKAAIRQADTAHRVRRMRAACPWAGDFFLSSFDEGKESLFFCRMF
ncbi:hypothetical protein WMW72_09035 [Paenibacillus filicis]|uniref:Uncharacterized protein n=1 Tax=Paenibacillus filicis TaxID=669464 RepID=A0ABU9DGP0_9BACL